MSCVFHGEAGPQHPIYGIHHENITDRLTRRNWRKKAVVRDNLRGWMYLWISRGHYRDKAGQTQHAYFIKVHAQQPKERIRSFEQEFERLDEALRYINGEDDGRIARGTWPADPESMYPSEQAAPIYIGFGRPIRFTPEP